MREQKEDLGEEEETTAPYNGRRYTFKIEFICRDCRKGASLFDDGF